MPVSGLEDLKNVTTEGCVSSVQCPSYSAEKTSGDSNFFISALEVETRWRQSSWGSSLQERKQYIHSHGVMMKSGGGYDFFAGTRVDRTTTTTRIEVNLSTCRFIAYVCLDVDGTHPFHLLALEIGIFTNIL